MKKFMVLLFFFFLISSAFSADKKGNDKDCGYIVLMTPKGTPITMNPYLFPRSKHKFQKRSHSLAYQKPEGFYFLPTVSGKNVPIRVFNGYITYVEVVPSENSDWKTIENPFGGSTRVVEHYKFEEVKLIEIVPIDHQHSVEPMGYFESEWWDDKNGLPVSCWPVKNK